MHHRRPTAIAGLLLALVPAALTLSSCGFDYPTDRVNTIAGGTNNQDASVDALGLRVLAYAPGEGRLIGALANNLDETASFVSVTAPGGEATAEFEPIEVEGRDSLNLSEDVVIPLTGSFTAGDVVTLELSFVNGDSVEESVSLNVPVVKNCFQYTQIPTPTPSEEAVESEVPVEGEAPAEGGAAGAAADEEAAGAVAEETESLEATEEDAEHAGEEHAEEGGDARFNCADEAPEPEGGEH